jgi:hypothetical protein
LIIRKEFDCFALFLSAPEALREHLDLVALDKDGIIGNKLDDSGRDVM